jgi:hypothetical protein
MVMIPEEGSGWWVGWKRVGKQPLCSLQEDESVMKSKQPRAFERSFPNASDYREEMANVK